MVAQLPRLLDRGTQIVPLAAEADQLDLSESLAAGRAGLLGVGPGQHTLQMEHMSAVGLDLRVAVQTYGAL